MNHIDISSDWGVTLSAIPALGDVKPWRLAVVLDVTGDAARIGLQPGREKFGEVARERETGLLTAEGMRWSGRTPRTALTTGDVIYVEPLAGRAGQYRLRQIPDISGAMVAMDPHTGRVFSMVGGFSFDQSSFNRATQALRQPGSSFKPFVYATALDNGYTPSSSILDEPISIQQADGTYWTPENFEGGHGTGAHPLRYGIEHSKNMMTVRLAKDVGMPLIAEYAKRFGVYDEMTPYLSMALGAGETTLLRMVTGYSMLANGGKRIKPTLIDRIQDRWGKTLYRHDERQCIGCDSAKWENQLEPSSSTSANRCSIRSPPIDHLDHGRRDPTRHRRLDQGGRQAPCRQDRHDERRERSLVHRLFARSRGRRLHRLRSATLARQPRPGRAVRRADLPRLHDGGSEGQARYAVPCAAGDQAHFHRRALRAALVGSRHDSRSVQAGDGAARLLLRRRRPASARYAA
jgi:membrane carboxypeptidase/penicillin-binding protein